MPVSWQDFEAVDEPKKEGVDWSLYEPEDFKVIDSGASIKEPSVPLSPELSTIYGGPKLATPDAAQVQSLLSETGQDIHEIMTRPAVPIPRFQITKDSSIPGAIAKSTANLALSVPEFLETPAGGMTAALAPAAPLLTALGFTGLGAHNLSEAATEAGSQWDTLSPPEKVASGITVGGAGLMTALPLLHATGQIRGNLGASDIVPPNEVADILRRFPDKERIIPANELESKLLPPIPETPTTIEKGQDNAAIFQRSPAETALGETPGNSQEVGARVPGPEEPPNAQGAAEASGNPPPQQGEAAGEVPVAESPVISKFNDALTSPKKAPSTEASLEVGMQAKTVDDLEALAKLRDDIKKHENPYIRVRSQLPREAIEAATNTGGHIEGESTPPTKLGERPLDWRTNPEVRDWLEKNAKRVGITLPEDFEPNPKETPLRSEAEIDAELDQLVPPEAPATKIKQVPEPTSFNSVEDVLKFRETRLQEERDLYKEQIGLTDDQAERLQRLLNSDRETTKFEKDLTPEQLKKFSAFFDGPFNQRNGPWKSIETDPRLNPQEIAEDTDPHTLSAALVAAVERGIEPNVNSDRFISAVIAARRLKELGHTKSDLARYIDDYTTRNSGSQGDKYEFFKSIGGKVNEFLKIQGIDLPEGELGKKVSPEPPKVEAPKPVEPPKAPEPAPVAPAEPKSDYDRYQELVKSIKGKSLDEALAIGKELEQIKNRNGGMPPKAPEVAAPKKAVAKMTFKEFLNAPREGELLDALRTLPKRELSPEEIAANQKYDEAWDNAEKAGLGWIAEGSKQTELAIKNLSKAKRKIADAYEKALNEKVRVSSENRDARQRQLYDQAVKAGIIESPEPPIEERGATGGNIGMAAIFDPANYKPQIEFAKQLFGKAKDFASWSGQMLKQFGDTVRDQLKAIWNHIRGKTDPASIADEMGLTFKAQDAPAVNFTGMPPEMVAQFKAQFKPQWEFTDRRKGSRTEGLTFYAPEGSTPQEIRQLWRNKLEAETGSGGLRLNVGANAAQGGFLGVDLRKLARLRQAMVTRLKAKPSRHVMDQTLDAADNESNIVGRQMGNRVKTGLNAVQDRAASVLVAAQFDRANLARLLAQSIAGKHPEAETAVRYAMANWNTVEPAARRGKAILDNQVVRENGNGINTQYAEGYLPGIYDMDLLMGAGRPFVIGGKGGGVGTSFKKGKTYANPFEAIADGYKPQSLQLSDLVEHRVKAGERLVNRVNWGDSLRSVTDPTDNKPIVQSLVKHARGPGQPGWEAAPLGYERRTIIPGMDVAVHEGYSKLFDALTGTSAITEFEPGGIPVGKAAMELAGGVKHGMLLFDTFHASRIGQKQMFLNKQFLPSYKKGLSLLEYNDADLNRAVTAGDITPEMAAYARANRPTANLLLKSGLNVGRIQEALYTSLARKIPIVGTFNKWVFEKMTRGAMMESGLIEFDRVKQNNPTWSDTQVAQKVARDLNVYFGSLGRQGIFKSATFQDAARLFALAPQWVESMARSELGGAKQLTIDPILKRQLATGTLGAGLAQGLVAYFVGTQLLNLVTRHQLTFQNPEKGHKLDAWIPDVTGKTGGYFLSPLAVVAELTHDALRLAKKDPDSLETAGHILANKSSPFWRTGKILLSGLDYNDQKIVGLGNKIKSAAIAMLPTPIAASTLIKGGQPGSTQRQLMASGGFKTEPADTARAQVANEVRQWMGKSTVPKIQEAYQAMQKEEFGPSKYKTLQTALQVGDKDKALSEVHAIIDKELTAADKSKRQKLILKAFDPFSHPSGQTTVEIKPFATHSKEMEKLFRSQLDAQGKSAYRQSIQDQVNLYRTLTEAMYGKAKYPEGTPEAYRR